METMNIAVPDSLKEFVQQRVAQGGYSSVSEYMRELIRADRKQAARQILESEILRGLNSGESVPMTDDDWNKLRDEVRARHASDK
jgi:antitoxin ParD1/3/4